MASTELDIPEFYTHDRHIYAFRHALNTVDVFLPKEAVEAENQKHWIVWIHGGAWRDPQIDALSIIPALHHLDPHKYGIPGVASINYGLSPYPDHPTDPGSPKDPSRNCVHPTHLEDVVSALAWLQNKFDYAKRYILAGHSCGATLAFQVLSRSARNIGTLMKDSPRAPLPDGVIGVHGIYDLPLLMKDFGSVPGYRTIIETAFGKDEGQWALASPVGWPYNRLWSEAKLALLAHSDEDELVNQSQALAMKKHLDRCSRATRRDVVTETAGKHDEIWQKGDGLARVLVEALKLLQQPYKAAADGSCAIQPAPVEA